MAPTTASELAEALRQADLLTQPQVVRVASELLPALSDDPQELAFALVQRGWLTSYQAELALQGKTAQLVVGGYRLLSPIGVGGMGEVFKAWQKRLNRTVALKLIRPELVRDRPAAIRRFRREALAVAQLSHPNIVSIYDADEANGTHFIVLEYVDGPDLERLVLEGGPLPPVLACDYVRQAALGLQHAHEAGLVHRDVKPSNLLLLRPGSARRSGAFSQGLVKVLDLGLARMESVLETKASLTREGAMMGTPDYVAPEQARDASTADIRADLYSLGCTFYFLLAGRPPFNDGTMMEKLLKHQQEEPAPIESLRSDVPREVGGIIRQLMAKSPDFRFQTPMELVEALEEVLKSHGAATGSMTPTPFPLASGSSAGFGSVPPKDAGRTPIPASSRTPLSPSPSPDAIAAAVATAPRVTVVTAPSLTEHEVPDSRELHERIAPANKCSVLRGHKGPVMGLAFSPDCKLLATGGVDSAVHVWFLGKTPREVATLQEPRLGDVQVVAFAPSGDYLVSGSASLNANMWKWSWRDSVDRCRVAIEGPSFSDALAFSPDGQNLVSGVGATIWMWSAADGAPRKRVIVKNQTGDVKALRFSPDSKTLASGDTGGTVQLWKLGWLGCRPETTLSGHRGSVSALAFSADSQLIASAGVDHSVCIWDGTGKETRAKAVLQGFKGIVRQLLYLPDTQMLLTACDGGQVILWNWKTGERQLEWRLEQPIICSLALASDGSLVAAGSTDGSATIYDLVAEEAA